MPGKDVSAELTAMHDQVRKAGDDRLDAFLDTVREVTAGESGAVAAMILTYALEKTPAGTVRELLQSATHRLLAQDRKNR